MNYLITQQQRDEIVKYLANSILPAKEAIAIINLLQALPPENGKPTTVAKK